MLEDQPILLPLSRGEATRLRHALHLANQSPELDAEQRAGNDAIQQRIWDTLHPMNLARNGRETQR